MSTSNNVTRIDMRGAVPLANGTLVDVWIAQQKGGMFSNNYEGTWLQVVDTGVIYSDALFYREASSVIHREHPASLEVRGDLHTLARLRGRIVYCRVAFTHEHQMTTLLVQYENAPAVYR
ncbi:hypothetical protein [Polyangium mundeleinium]|uniref:Uncharacterized protein n=1 Tax=Polyangium mundeleinium TaxID=2995306 RepID=A0ABT5EQ26_9BACT|nr:hypothetical protein [Polyangium mundeleinium]MDC0743856.1 hypothetical protein [Polyangium mundeleinium]